jgi:hypothetical protein
MNNTTKCPDRFRAAYDHVAAAGEVAELTALARREHDDGPLRTYCDEAAANDAGDVTSSEIYGLALWLISHGAV